MVIDFAKKDKDSKYTVSFIKPCRNPVYKCRALDFGKIFMKWA